MITKEMEVSYFTAGLVKVKVWSLKVIQAEQEEAFNTRFNLHSAAFVLFPRRQDVL